jgi:hypothetical protein
VLRFLALLLVLSLPFWLLGWTLQAELLPGLPLSGLMAFCPALAALILTVREAGARAAGRLGARAFDVARLRGRMAWIPLIALMPLLMLALSPVFPHAAPAPMPVWAPLAMLAAFFVAAVGEELGWSAVLLERLQPRIGELAAGLLIGVVWAAWHLIPFSQADRSWDWIAWQCLKTVEVRVVMTRLYLGCGRSLFAVALFHALDNVAAFSLPAFGVVYDPRLTALVLIAIAAALQVTRRRATI